MTLFQWRSLDSVCGGKKVQNGTPVRNFFYLTPKKLVIYKSDHHFCKALKNCPERTVIFKTHLQVHRSIPDQQNPIS